MSDSLIPSDPEARKRWATGVALLALSVVLGYFFLVYPVHEGLKTGKMTYSAKTVICAPLVCYCGLILMFTQIKNGDLRTRKANGKAPLNRTGWFVVLGGIAFLAVIFAIWSFYVESLGFHDAAL